MNLYLLKQNDNNGFATYDSCIVCAESEQQAREMHPDGSKYKEGGYCPTWAIKKESIKCQLIGKAAEGWDTCVVLASYNAG